MESMGDLLKAWPTGQAITEQAEQKMAELLAGPLVEKLLVKYPELDERVIRLNLNRVYQYVTEYRNCSNCPGLEKCPNDFQGHYTLLHSETVNGHTQLYDRKVACKKFISRQNEDHIRSRIRSFYVDETALQRGYSSDEILTNDLERAKAVG